CTWTPTTTGDYSLTAEATDDKGAVTRSTAINVTVNDAPNVPPTAAITSPANGGKFVQNSLVTIVASAVDTDGTVAQVAFFANGVLITGCIDTIAPYECAWTPSTVGAYSLTAEATDNNNAVGTASAVTVTVEAKVTGQTPPQSVYLPLVSR